MSQKKKTTSTKSKKSLAARIIILCVAGAMLVSALVLPILQAFS